MINLGAHTKKPLDQWYKHIVASESNPEIKDDTDALETLFDNAQIEIFGIINTDCLVRFQQTPEFEEIQKRWTTDDLLNSLNPAGGSGGSPSLRGSAFLNSRAQGKNQVGTSEVPMTALSLPRPSTEGIES